MKLGGLSGYLANAGKVRTQGVELDSAYQPNARFSAYLNAAYTDAKYVRFLDGPCSPELLGGTVATGAHVPGPAGVAGALSPAKRDVWGQRLPGV